MLDAFRNHKRWLMFIAMVLIIPSFVVTGIYSYNRMMEADDAIAKVGEESITPQMFDQQKRVLLENLRSSMGENFKASMLDNPEGRQLVLTQLMNDAALKQTIAKEYIRISEEDAIRVIKGSSALQKDGKFDPELYEQFLRARGISDQQMVLDVRNDLARSTLTNNITSGAIIPDEVVNNLHRILTIESKIRTRIFNVDEFLPKVTVTDDEIKAYYEKHLEQFKAPEEISVQYLVFTPQDVKDDVKVNEEELRTYYEQNKNRWTVPEQRQASHILIGFDSVKGDKEAALKKANEVLEKVKANPDDFAKLAKEYSTDPGSAGIGGDLGYFGRGMMVPAFEKAVFDGKEGDIIGPVETEFGYHIIKVTGIRPASVRSFDEVRSDIEKLYREQALARAFAPKAEDFTNLSYEQPDSLDPIAEKFGLKIQSVDHVTRQGVADPQVRRFLNDHVIESLFADDSLKDKHNTSAIEVSPNVLVTARVSAHSPAHTRTLDEVKAEVATGLKLQAASKLAKEAGEKVLASLKSAKEPNLDGFSNPVDVSVSKPLGHPRDLVMHVGALTTDTWPVFTGMTVEGGAYIIAEVLSHKTEVAKPEVLDGLRNELVGVYGQTELTGYFEALRARWGTKILRPQFLEGNNNTQD